MYPYMVVVLKNGCQVCCLLNKVLREKRTIFKSILTHRLPELLPKMHFWTFGRFPTWICAKLAPIYSKRQLQHDSMPFFPLAPHFTTFFLGHAQKSNFGDSDLPVSLQAFQVFRFFFHLSFFFPFLIFLW